MAAVRKLFKILASHLWRVPRWEAFYMEGEKEIVCGQWYRFSNAENYVNVFNFTIFLATNGSQEYARAKVRRINGNLQAKK